MIIITFKFPKVKKGGPGSGHHGHSGRPGKVGGSLAGRDLSSLSERTLSKIRNAFDKRKYEGVSSGHVGKDNLKLLDDLGYVETNDGTYYKLTSKGKNALTSAVSEIAPKKKVPSTFDPTTVTRNDKLSFANAKAYLSTLPGYDDSVVVDKMTNDRIANRPGARANARYWGDGVIELPSNVRAYSVAHELGHYVYDYKLPSNLRAGAYREYMHNLSTPQTSASVHRIYALSNQHEWFADSYAKYLYGDSQTRSALRAAYPLTIEAVVSIVGE